jgi:hypothetical protein
MDETFNHCQTVQLQFRLPICVYFSIIHISYATEYLKSKCGLVFSSVTSITMIILVCQHVHASYSFKDPDPPPSLCFMKRQASHPFMSPLDISRDMPCLKPWSQGKEESAELSLIMSILVWWNGTYCEVRSWLDAGMTSC